MTAAAIRPDLFTHLFATQRAQHDKRDVAASALSLLLHGSAALAIVWASTSIEPAEKPVVEVVHPLTFVSPDVVSRAQSGGGGGSGGAGRSLVVPNRFDLPMLNAPNPVPFNPGDFARPADPTPAASKNPTGTGTAGPEVRRGFEVISIAPALLNPQDVKRALERNYPAILRDAGIGGRVMLWLLLDETGRVIDTDVKESSGHAAFDNAAQNVGQIMRFSPAMNRDERVKVWVALPIVFTTR